MILATNTFGLGIDKPDIRVVIYIGAIHQLSSYRQESSRAGRDRERSQAIILVGKGLQEGLQQKITQAKYRPGKRIFVDEKDQKYLE